MNTNIGYAGLAALKVGDRILYVAGSRDWHIEAEVTVVKTPGSTGVMVNIEKILQKGSAVTLNEGDQDVLAGATEVYYRDTN